MISLISPALIIPALLYRRRLHGSSGGWPVLDASGSPLVVGLRVQSSSAREPISQPGELAVQAAVHDQAAALGAEAAEQLLVQHLLDGHLLSAECLPEPRRQRRALVGGQRHHRAHPSARAVEIHVHERAVRVADLRQDARAAARGHEAEEVAHELAEAQPLGDLVGGTALGGGRDAGPREKVLERRVAAHDLHRLRQLGADRLDLAALAGEVLQRLGVGARGAARLHRPIRAMLSSTRRRWSSSRRLLRTSFSATAMAISLTSRRSSSRARRMSASVCAFADSTSCCASRRAASTSLRCSSAASFSAAARIDCASAYAARRRSAFSSACRAASARAACASSSDFLMAAERSSILARSGL